MEPLAKSADEIGEIFILFIRLIGVRDNLAIGRKEKNMDNGASSYHHFLQGDNSGLEELVEMYNDSLSK